MTTEHLRGDHWLHLTLTALGVTILAAVVAVVFVLCPPAALLLFPAAILLWHVCRDPFWGIVLIFAALALGVLGNITDTGSVTVLKILTALVALIWIASILVRQEITGALAALSHPTNIVLGVLCLLMLLSVFNAYDAQQATVSFLRIMSCIGLYLLVVLIVRSDPQVRIVAKVIIFFGFWLSLGGVYEHLTHKSVQNFFGKKHYLSVGAESGHLLSTYHAGAISPTAETKKGAWARVQTTFGDPNFFGAYLVSVIAFLIGAWLGARTRLVKYGYALILLLALFSLWGTGSRGSMTALMGVLFLYFVCLPMRFKVPAFFVLLLLSVAVAVGVSSLPQFRTGLSVSAAKSSPRAMVWTMAFHMIRDHPILGVGIGNFTSVYSHYRIPQAPLNPLITHSTLFEIWSEMGTFAAFLGVAYMVLVMAQLWWVSCRLRDRKRFHLVLSMMTAVFGYTLSSFTLSMLDDHVYWCLIAFAIAGSEALRRSEGIPPLLPAFGVEAQAC